MKVSLDKIDSVPDMKTNSWRVRALLLEGKSFAITAMRNWRGDVAAGLSKIITSLQVVAQTRGYCRDERHAKRSTNYPGAWEVLAYQKKARLMFFYSEEENLVICTNGMLKGDNQNRAFRDCLDLREQYLKRNL